MKIYLNIKQPIVIIIFTAIISFEACQEPYFNDDLRATQRIPVFNATVTNIDKLTSFNLYYAMPYTNQNQQNIEGAYITISNELGENILLNEDKPGHYILPTRDNWFNFGSSYTATIELPNGEIIKSNECYFNDILPIGDVFFDFNIRTSIVKNPNGDYSEVNEEGIFVKAKLLQANEKPYFYRSTTNYYVHSQEWKSRIGEYTIYEDHWEIKYEIHYDTLFDVYEGTSNIEFPLLGEIKPGINYSQKDLTISPLFLVADNECNNFTRYTSNKFIEWVVPIDIYHCSKEVFTYYSAAAAQLEASGQIFDPIPEQIMGNMYNETNATKPALGLFEMSAVNRKYLSIYVYESLGYKSYQSRILNDTVIAQGKYPNRWTIDTVFVDSIPIIK